MTSAERDQLAKLSRRLTIPFWHERRDVDGITAIAGARGMIKPASAGLGHLPLIVLRPAASAAVRGVKHQLIEAGLLTEGRGALMLARMPTEAEAPKLRDLLGLHGPYGARGQGGAA